MLRKQFAQLIYDLRAELGRSVDPAAGVSDLPSLKQTLSRNYETLYADYDWPHLSVISARENAQPGQRYYDFPENMTFDTIEAAVVWQGNVPLDIERGIGFEDYAFLNPDLNGRADPIRRWDVRFVERKEMIEFWPLPAGVQAYQFKGRLAFKPLIDDKDLCLIDDQLVVLMSAVEILPRQKSADANVKLSAVQRRYAKLRGRSRGGNQPVRVGLGRGARTVMPETAIVRVGRS